MADPAAGLRQDRALRNAARTLLDNDLAAIRSAAAGHKEKAQALPGQAAEFAGDHRAAIGGALALATAALTAWVLRGRIAGWLVNAAEDGTPAEMQDGAEHGN